MSKYKLLNPLVLDINGDNACPFGDVDVISIASGIPTLFSIGHSGSNEYTSPSEICDASISLQISTSPVSSMHNLIIIFLTKY